MQDSKSLFDENSCFSVPLETNLARKGLVRLGRADSTPIDSRDLYGIVQASEPLRLLDLEIAAWLARVARFEDSSATFSRYQLAMNLYGRRPGGRERRLIAESLSRLESTRLTFGGYDAQARTFSVDAMFSDVPILESLAQVAGGATGRGQLWEARFAPWLAAQLAWGHVTFLDWSTLRQLSGLAKRLWIALETENMSRYVRIPDPFGPSGDDSLVRGAWLALTPAGFASLGLSYTNRSDALKAVELALHRVKKADSRYDFTIEAWGRFHRIVAVRARRIEARGHQSGEFNQTGLLVGARRRTWRRRSDRRKPDPLVITMGSVDLPNFYQDASYIVVRIPGRPATIHDPHCPVLADVIDGGPGDVEFVIAPAVDELKEWHDEQRLPQPMVCDVCSSYLFG